MRISDLVQSGVVFNEDDHTYTLNGKRLRGITGMIKEQLFPDMYKDVPQYVLNKAAKMGSSIHKSCQLYDEVLFDDGTPQVSVYAKLLKESGYHHVGSEYIVTDGSDFASPIDKVLANAADELALGDIKSVNKMDDEAKKYVAWQLSIYKWLFELQNFPDLKVGKLFCIWLPKNEIFLEKACMFEVPYMGDEAVAGLLACARRGEQYVVPTSLQNREQNVPVLAQDAIDMLVKAEAMVKKWQQRYDDIKTAAMESMKKYGVKSWDCEQLKMTYVPEGSSQRFDSAAFKKDHPDLYAQYMKETKTKESIRITIR